MSLRDLSSADLRIVGECLRAVASGQMILDDEEFPVLFGIGFQELCAVAAAWPDVEVSDAVMRAAVGNSLNTLVGYPHHREAVWNDHVSVPPDEVARILAVFLATES